MLIIGPGYEIYITKEVKKEHKDESKEKAADDMTHEEKEEGGPPVSLVTHVKNILHSNFSNNEV